MNFYLKIRLVLLLKTVVTVKQFLSRGPFGIARLVLLLKTVIAVRKSAGTKSKLFDKFCNMSNEKHIW